MLKTALASIACSHLRGSQTPYEPCWEPCKNRGLPTAEISHLLLWHHSGKHLDVRDELQQLLPVHKLEVRETFPGYTQVVLLRQLPQRGWQDREHDGAVDGLPLPAGVWKEKQELDISVPARSPAVRNAPRHPTDAEPGACSPSVLQTRGPPLLRTVTCLPLI